MAVKSSIKTLPEAIKELADRLLGQDRKTQLEILELVNERLSALGEAPVSRSAFNRYAQYMQAVGENVRRSREIAAVWGKKLEDMPEGDIGRVVIEITKTLALVTASAMSSSETPAPPKELQALARAVKDLEAAATLSAQREVFIRNQVVDELTKKLDGAVKDAAKAGEPGLSAERVAQLRRDFLGVRNSPPK